MCGADAKLIGLTNSPKALAEILANIGSGDLHPLVFSVGITKTPGRSLGIDVAYSSCESWARHGVFVSQVLQDGLVAAAGAENGNTPQVQRGDFIYQVNDVHGDVVTMVQEMKVKQVLSIHVLRRQAASPEPELAGGNSADALVPLLTELDDDALVSFIDAVLQERPWLRDAVLDQGDAGNHCDDDVAPQGEKDHMDAEQEKEEKEGMDEVQEAGEAVDDVEQDSAQDQVSKNYRQIFRISIS